MTRYLARCSKYGGAIIHRFQVKSRRDLRQRGHSVPPPPTTNHSTTSRQSNHLHEAESFSSTLNTTFFFATRAEKPRATSHQYVHLRLPTYIRTITDSAQRWTPPANCLHRPRWILLPRLIFSPSLQRSGT